MILPIPPAIKQIDRISPTLYEAASKCVARAAWLVAGDRTLVPLHPRALLGITVHAVLERARLGFRGTTEEQNRDEATRFFDEKARELYDAAHPLLKAKFESPERLPYYYLFRSRAVHMALDFKVERTTPRSSGSVRVKPARLTVGPETMLVSRDGHVSGRPDVIDADKGEVTDYKTGSGDTAALSDAEYRQLRLYAYLAGENGIAITTGVIQRVDGTRIQIAISAHEASEEGSRALDKLAAYNSFAGRPFESGASPSKEACRNCACIPFCEPFWRDSEVGWSADVGTHVEGVIESVDGDALVSFNLKVNRGTGATGQGVVTRLSREWLTLPGVPFPQPDQVLRVIDVGYAEGSVDPAVFRADRISTTIWTLHSQPR